MATWSYPQLPVATQKCPWLTVATHGYPQLTTATCSYPRLPVATQRFLQLPKATCSYPPLPVATHGYLWLPTATHSYPRLPVATLGCPWLPLPGLFLRWGRLCRWFYKARYYEHLPCFMARGRSVWCCLCGGISTVTTHHTHSPTHWVLPDPYPPISIVGPGSSSIAAAKHGVGNKILAEAKATLGNLWP